jgi:hypothetical protein
MQINDNHWLQEMGSGFAVEADTQGRRQQQLRQKLSSVESASLPQTVQFPEWWLSSSVPLSLGFFGRLTLYQP